VEGDEEKDIIKNIKHRFENLKDDEINFIRKNAMEYYDNYIEYKKNVYWMRHCLEL
jgi:23S rRNA U2552 (ribose-2'-O)-methylase RlmE/FtsJ